MFFQYSQTKSSGQDELFLETIETKTGLRAFPTRIISYDKIPTFRRISLNVCRLRISPFLKIGVRRFSLSPSSSSLIVWNSGPSLIRASRPFLDLFPESVFGSLKTSNHPFIFFPAEALNAKR